MSEKTDRSKKITTQLVDIMTGVESAMERQGFSPMFIYSQTEVGKKQIDQLSYTVFLGLVGPLLLKVDIS